MNVGNLFRSAHAFGASYLFTIGAAYDREAADADVQAALAHAEALERDGAPAEDASPNGAPPNDAPLIDEPLTDAALERRMELSDTSGAAANVPIFSYPDVDSLDLPKGCALVGVELLDESIPLPSFKHPRQAAYVLGPEKGSLSPELTARCAHLVQIPMAFCVNVGVAGAILMYDRLTSLGRFDPRPVRSGGPTEFLPPHVRGGRRVRG